MRCFLLIMLCFFCTAIQASPLSDMKSSSVTKGTQVLPLNQEAMFFFDYDGKFRSAFDFEHHTNNFRPLNEINKKPKMGIYSKWAYIKLDNSSDQKKWMMSFGFPRLAKLSVYKKPFTVGKIY